MDMKRLVSRMSQISKYSFPKEEENKSKDGARLHTSRKTRLKYGPKNSLSGTKPRHRREKPAAAVSMFLGQKTE